MWIAIKLKSDSLIWFDKQLRVMLERIADSFRERSNGATCVANQDINNWIFKLFI